MELINYLSEESLAKAGITLAELTAIREDFEKKAHIYEQAAKSVTDTLLAPANRRFGVHSARYRVKDPSHLIEKIVRKRLKDNTRVINLDNYEQEMTDLAGVRALHLFKGDWQLIHDFITETWEPDTPTAYHREGDPLEVLAMFTEKECKTEAHQYGYRSVHYLVETSLTKAKLVVEIQVRTLFEEGWSEIDHKIRYPNFSNDPLTNSLLSQLNRVAGSADEMSSLVQQLHLHLQNSKYDAERSQLEHEEKVKNVVQVIDDLKLSKQNKSRLNDALKSLG
jgi:putative GTP pyrophosphokinase